MTPKLKFLIVFLKSLPTYWKALRDHQSIGRGFLELYTSPARKNKFVICYADPRDLIRRTQLQELPQEEQRQWNPIPTNQFLDVERYLDHLS